MIDMQKNPAENKNKKYIFFRPNLSIKKKTNENDIISTVAEIAKLKYGLIPRSLLFKLTP
jgi:hypothetical protein